MTDKAAIIDYTINYNTIVQDFATRNHSNQCFNEAGDINSPPVIFSRAHCLKKWKAFWSEL